MKAVLLSVEEPFALRVVGRRGDVEREPEPLIEDIKEHRIRCSVVAVLIGTARGDLLRMVLRSVPDEAHRLNLRTRRSVHRMGIPLRCS